MSDLDEWLVSAATENGFGSSYLPGDANLDGVVDTSDFNIWNEGKFTQSTDWDNGDFNGDGFVDTSDFNIWNDFKFLSSDSIAAVPEPSSLALALMSLVAVFWRRSR